MRAPSSPRMRIDSLPCRLGRLVGRARRWTVCVLLATTVGGCVSSGLQPEQAQKVAEVNTRLAFEYYVEKNYVAAASKLDKALAADEDYVEAQVMGGILYESIGELERAEEFFRRALQLAPKNVLALNNYGQFLCARGRFDEGLAQFRVAAAEPLNPSPLVTLNNAGQCAFEANDVALAERSLREALAFNPELAPALLTMARISLATDRSLSARAYLQRYEAVAPHTAASLAAAFQIETALGDTERAITYMNQLRRQFPDSPEAANLPDRRPRAVAPVSP